MPSIGSGQGFRIRLGVRSSGLASRVSDSGLCRSTMAPTVSTQSKRGRSETYDGRSGNGIRLSAAICSSGGGGRDGSAGSEGGGISAVTRKLGSAGSGGGGIVSSAVTSGRVDVGGSGAGVSMARGVAGKVGSAGSGGDGISAATGKLGSADSGGGGSATTAGGSRQIGGSFGCCDTCGRRA
jgi:hypothetical protein